MDSWFAGRISAEGGRAASAMNDGFANSGVDPTWLEASMLLASTGDASERIAELKDRVGPHSIRRQALRQVIRLEQCDGYSPKQSNSQAI
jgi:hypothetical protein